MTDYAGSGGGRPMPNKSSKHSLFSLGHTMKLFEILLQLFEVNYENRIMIYKINISELLKTIPKSLPPKSPNDYQGKYQTTIKAVVGGWFLEKANSKITPIKRSWFSKR